MSAGGRLSFKAIIATAGLLALVACDQQSGGRKDSADARVYTADVGNGTIAELTDGPMAEVNECVERNNTDLLDEDAALSACAWAHSVSFAGLPPGVTGHMGYEWPSAVITIRNNNAMILVTQICIRAQLETARTVQAACGKITVGPMDRTTTSIMMQSELEAIGVGPDYLIDPETFRWEVLSVRYLRLLESVAQE